MVTALTELFGFEGSQVDLLSFPFFSLLVLCVVLPGAFVDGAECFSFQHWWQKHSSSFDSQRIF